MDIHLLSPLLPPTLYSRSLLKLTNILYIYVGWKRLFREKKKALIRANSKHHQDFFKKSDLIFKHEQHWTLFESFHAPPSPLFPPSSLVIIYPPYATQKVPCACSCNNLVIVGFVQSRPTVGYMQMGLWWDSIPTHNKIKFKHIWFQISYPSCWLESLKVMVQEAN